MMQLPDDTIRYLSEWVPRIRDESFSYRNLLGQDLAPIPWTPVVTFGTPGDLSVVYSLQDGMFMKIGRLITGIFGIQTSTFTHTTASSSFRITGLPFAAVGASYGSVASFRGITKANYTQLGWQGGSDTIMYMRASGSGQVDSTVVPADVPSGGTVILRGQFSYFTAS